MHYDMRITTRALQHARWRSRNALLGVCLTTHSDIFVAFIVSLPTYIHPSWKFIDTLTLLFYIWLILTVHYCFAFLRFLKNNEATG